jgi:hypothetical protein
VIFLALFTHPLKITLRHFARRLRNALLLNCLGRVLAGLANFAGEFSTILLLKTLAGRVAIENLLSLGVEFDFGPGIK